MNIAGLLKKIGVGLAAGVLGVMPAFAQQDLSEDQLFQQFQAMVIVEEANQHCPLLSRLEAEVLRGQIVFAKDTFAGQLDMVEKFKKEARIFSRRSSCNSPDILGLVGLARQAAYDYMINHLLLARQINVLDRADRSAGTIPSGLLLDFITDEEWTMIDELREEVKANYLSQASEEAWHKFVTSIEDVAGDRSAKLYLENQAILEMDSSENFQTAQAMARNREITTYYYHLDRTVRAFLSGATADERNYPYSRAANDFTDWISYRPKDGTTNWVISYPGCAGFDLSSECTLFTTVNGELGVVVGDQVQDVTLEYRNPGNETLRTANKTVEGPIGSNMLHEANMNSNLEAMLASADKVLINATPRLNTEPYAAQTGEEASANAKVFIFPEGTLAQIEELGRNDVIYLSVDTLAEEGNNKSTVIPVHNYHRAKNWAYSVQ